ncbi:Holliday junction ATP-dependent DNA helicase RuvB [Paenibacillus konkukensis]|uniref:Holliday junction ATP-dependent DNA helicase RuvB n=1 Tax=Paenibacillus konkukensis TaxID=2020716 RepID=A0ABY4RI63_9BACL|nr:MoxR family ATPase [Paenibacillus konkukensis]UQZ81475.1 Holliday junction ATP-dependent DNA helicase RuvB [Paenibacillus konkukensis]
MQLSQIQSMAQTIAGNVNKVIVGKEDVIDKLLIAMIASGHVLLEDVPGTGKTLLAKAMAKSINGSFKRIQFTPDLLPSDLSGINYYNQKHSEFEFRPGPLFTNILLADEINRATPRTQSSLLECMEERQVSIDGETKELGRPFLVIATQNPVENQGTFPLPEAQLDRFLFKVKMGYPTTEQGLDILKRFKSSNPLEDIASVAEAADIAAAQRSYSQVAVSDELMLYLLRIVEKTRTHGDVATGVSPRGSQALLKAAQVHALLRGRDFVIPDDVKRMAGPVLAHRIIVRGAFRSRHDAAEAIVASILQEVAVPTESDLVNQE